MPKNRQHHKAQQNNGSNTAVSIEPQYPQQVQGQEACASTTDAGYMPSYEEIQKRAYQIHIEKGGKDFENWLEAERMIKEENQVAH